MALSFPVFPPSAHSVKEKRHFVVSLTTLSNQDSELHKEAFLSACEHESRILLFVAMSGYYYYCYSLGDIERRKGAKHKTDRKLVKTAGTSASLQHSVLQRIVVSYLPPWVILSCDFLFLLQIDISSKYQLSVFFITNYIKPATFHLLDDPLYLS